MRCFLAILLMFPSLLTAQVDSLKQELKITSGKDRISILNLLTVQDTQKSLLWHKEAMQLADQLVDNAGKAEALGAAAKQYANRHQFDEALAFYRQAVDLARKHDLKEQLASLLPGYAGTSEHFHDYETAIDCYREALEISRRSGTKKDAAQLMEHLGFAFFYKQDYNNALRYFNECLVIDKELNDSTGMAATLNNIGTACSATGEYDKSLGYLNKALTIYKLMNDHLNTAHTLQNIAINYREKASYELALSHSLDAARYFEKAGADKELSSCYNTIGNIQLELGATEKALSYHFLSLKIREKIGYKRGIAISLTNIGNVYKEQKKYDQALDHLNRSLQMKEELGDKRSIAVTLDQLGEVYYYLDNYTLAGQNYLRSLHLARQVDDQKGIAATSRKLGELRTKQGRYAEAAAYLDTALTIASATGAKNMLMESYEAFARLYRLQGNAEQAFLFYDKFTALKDSLLNEKRNKALAEMQVKYETERKEQEILLLGEKQKVQAAEMERQNTAIYGLGLGAGLLIVLTLVSFAAYRSKQKANRQSQVIIRQKQELIEQEKTMMKELHHRVKNNLQLLSGLLLLQKEQLPDLSARQAVDAVDHRVNAMLLIHQELYLDKARSQVAMRDYIQRMARNLLHAYGHTENSVDLVFDVEDLSMDAETALNLGLIINEVVSNSFKHAFAHVKEPRLMISLRRDEKGRLTLKLSDNGPGIPAGAMDNGGTSFGLRLVEMLGRNELKGTLNTSSEQGASFELII